MAENLSQKIPASELKSKIHPGMTFPVPDDEETRSLLDSVNAFIDTFARVSGASLGLRLEKTAQINENIKFALGDFYKNYMRFASKFRQTRLGKAAEELYFPKFVARIYGAFDAALGGKRYADMTPEERQAREEMIARAMEIFAPVGTVEARYIIAQVAKALPKTSRKLSIRIMKSFFKKVPAEQLKPVASFTTKPGAMREWAEKYGYNLHKVKSWRGLSVKASGAYGISGKKGSDIIVKPISDLLDEQRVTVNEFDPIQTSIHELAHPKLRSVLSNPKYEARIIGKVSKILEEEFNKIPKAYLDPDEALAYNYARKKIVDLADEYPELYFETRDYPYSEKLGKFAERLMRFKEE